MTHKDLLHPMENLQLERSTSNTAADAAVRHTTEERVLDAHRFECGFPIELWAEIIAYIAQPSVLTHIALACQTLRPEAERALYRNASVGPRDQSVLQFCETVAKCSRRAAAVKSLRIVFPFASDSAVVVRQALAKAFEAMVCVEGLYLLRHWSGSSLTSGNMHDALNYSLNLHRPGPMPFVHRHPRVAETMFDELGGSPGWFVRASEEPPLLLEWPHIHTLACPGVFLFNLSLPRSQITYLDLREYYHDILVDVATLFGHALVGLRLGLTEPRPYHIWSPGDIAAKFPRLRRLHLEEHSTMLSRSLRGWRVLDGRARPFQGHGIAWDAEPTTRTLGRMTGTLTLVWVAWHLHGDVEHLSRADLHHLANVDIGGLAQRLLQRWAPYITRVAFWFRPRYEPLRAFTSWTVDNDGGVVVEHTPNETIEYSWEGGCRF
ncbi:hypothetical protein VTO73DRAFT_13520 [Trametes versicolor]